MNWLCWELRWQISSISYRFQDKLNWKGQLVPIGGWNRIISTFELSYFSSNLNAVFLQDVHFHDQALSQYRKKWAIFFMENRLYWAQSKKFHIFHLIIFLITFPACVFQSDLTKPVIMVYKIKRCWMGPRLKIEKKPRQMPKIQCALQITLFNTLCIELFAVTSKILYPHLLLIYTCSTFLCRHAVAVSCFALHRRLSLNEIYK